jgi:N-acetylmuramic acid 6-phosphate (MurNAc-6-P) etherase
VGQPAPGSFGLQEQSIAAMVAGGVTLLAPLVEGGDAEAEEWRRLESAPLRADATLETTDCMLSGFGDVISISRASVTGNLH